ncbi:MAG: bactofilin family protein [Inquilinaceae bacterium]
MPIGSRASAPAFKPAMPADAIDPSGGADKTMHSRRATDKGKDASRQLIVGRDISLSGEITACDHLIVEGEIKAKLRGCRRIDISSAGKFNGSADIETADIGGRFDGELTVRGRLTLRSDGVVSGKLSYGEIAVEAGGRIIGEMTPLETPQATDAPAVPDTTTD